MKIWVILRLILIQTRKYTTDDLSLRLYFPLNSVFEYTNMENQIADNRISNKIGFFINSAIPEGRARIPSFRKEERVNSTGLLMPSFLNVNPHAVYDLLRVEFKR